MRGKPTPQPPPGDPVATGSPAPLSREETARRHAGGADAPRLADGVELIGEYEDSGYREPPYIARRSDGRVIQMTRLLYLVAEQVDGSRRYEEIAQGVAARFGRPVTAENVRFLIDQKLRPLGILTAADGTSPSMPQPDHPLALRYRMAVVPQRAVAVVARVFRPLFVPVLVALALAAVAAVDVWLFTEVGLGPGVRAALYEPWTILVVFGLVVVSAAFHECGHAAACLYGGARPGAMGAGLYLIWPAFYTNVTDAYRLSRRGRLRTDLGGIYFNLLFVLATAAVYAATRFEPLLLLLFAQHMEILRHFFPFVRLDGYYVFSDLTGVPDLFSRMKPILRSLLPGREPGPEVSQLKPSVRWVVTAWVLTVVAVIGLTLAAVAVQVPRLAATAADSAGIQWDRLQHGLVVGDAVSSGAAALQLVFVVLPFLGILLIAVRLLTKALTTAARISAARPTLRPAMAGVTMLGAGLLVFLWWPNGEYKPLQAGEQLTGPELIGALSQVPTGRPGLDGKREGELGGAPPLRGTVEPGEPVVAVFGARPGQPASGATAAGTASEAGPTPAASSEPTSTHSVEPTLEPTPSSATEPSGEATTEPSEEPTSQPSGEATTEPSEEPTSQPSEEATSEPSPEATSTATSSSTAEPTPDPTAEPNPS